MGNVNEIYEHKETYMFDFFNMSSTAGGSEQIKRQMIEAIDKLEAEGKGFLKFQGFINYCDKELL